MPKKIAIIGPESSGKSTLGKELSSYYNTPLVEEYARTYLEENGSQYAQADLDLFLTKQLADEQEKIKAAKRFLFCDTNALSTYIWSEVKYGESSSFIHEKLNKMDYDLYLLCSPDLEYAFDPLRESPELHQRQHLFDLHLQKLEKEAFNYAIVSGKGADRLKAAIQFLETQFPV